MLKRFLQRWRPRQRSQLTLIASDGTQRLVIHETDDWIEAPNWTPDGAWLIFNSAGRLFRVPADGTRPPMAIETGAIADITNDHLVSPDGSTIFFTARGCIYAVALEGGIPRKVSTDHSPLSTQYYVHGISPDGTVLSCTGFTPEGDSGTLAIFTLSASGGAGVKMTHGDKPVDGPEFSPDGRWIYFNGEMNARIPGDSQLFRMHTDGTNIEQLTHDRRVNWFPHVSPDGLHVVYLSYPENTQGHPASADVTLRLMPAHGGEPMDVIALFGGQGSINTNSWAPDGKRFAYVAYPLASSLHA